MVTVAGGHLDFGAEKAKALMAETGFPDGLTDKMIARQSPSYGPFNQVLQAQSEEVDINPKLKWVDHATWHQVTRQYLGRSVTYGAARCRWRMCVWHSFSPQSIICTETAVTSISHCNVADALIDAARVEIYPQKQIELWQEARRATLGL